ncbi:DNA-binding SARP family transcriptional activator [Asanoa ferruginea]|uniref:DNA-binding SARP family transcriptional activator n=1 Tax=Asanoa ferruginea TaxID=53367 RepID=A0A3D9ZCA8_9ACTN|nr:AfsR/SARP family transcriptional regulator [Asanoa ferruginea]REF94941.1 DNA-binding SARP family transcriptional activator [Asanoa ferruginea]GIF45479.1 SARP family transcriptional regulator [Asanoa ferruginea]
MEFRLLGPVEVVDGDTTLGIGRRQERCVLAILLLEPGQLVPVGRLVELLWSGEPPRGARAVLQTYISRLRALLGDGARIELHNGAYRIQVDPRSVDAHRFSDLVARARETTDPLSRGDLLRRAVALWQGPALDGIGPGRERLGARLEEARKTALDLRIVADLEAGRHAELIGELTDLSAGAPLDERLTAHLMTALFRDGRRAEALDVYTRARDRIRDDLGLDPGESLRHLHTAILRDDPALRPAAAARLSQLPAAVPDFVGRAALLDQLDTLVGDGRTTVVVSAIDGAGGVGKTALAVRWAHRVADRFPDGQLFVNLRGYETVPPVRPVDALARFLRALGLPGDRIPTDLDEAGALYRSELAGRRVLIVLDNAATAEQVRPLLPGSPSCVVVVTSRAQLGGLTASHGARRLTVDLLTEPEAVLLLRTIIGGSRVDAEPDAAVALVRACGLLPLAVRIAAAQLDASPTATLDGYVRALDQGPLDRLAIEGDELSGVRAAFRASYVRLSLVERDLFRVLGAVPGTDVSAAGAAALAGSPVDAALAGLVAAHLVTVPRPGRFGLHDLLRAYARELTDPAEAKAAVGRLHAYYLATADAAGRLLYPHMVRLPLADLPKVDEFAANPAALAWLDAEHRNLLAAIGHAATAGPARGSWELTDALRGYFWQTSHTVDWLAAVNASLDAAEREGDLRAQAAMHTSIALAQQSQGHLAEAAAEFDTAADLSDRAGWSHGQAAASGNLGVVLKNMGDFAGAARRSERALELHRANGFRPGEASTLITLGGLYHDLGELRRAADYCVTALAMHEEIGSRVGQMIALNNLAAVEHLLGEPTAADRFRAAMELQSDVGKAYSQAHLLGGLATVQRDRGELTLALANAEAALDKAREAADPMVEGDILSVLATVHHWLGRPDQAVDEHRQGLALLGAGSEYVRTRANVGLAAALRDTGDLTQAATVAAAALADARRAGHRIPAGNAYLLLGSIHLQTGDIDRAVECGQQALVTHRATGHRLGEARVLRLLGDIARANGLGTIAREQWHASLALLSEVGSGEVADVLKRS